MTGLLVLTTQLRLVGLTLVTLGLSHAALPAALGWRRDLSGVGPLNRHVLYTHTFFIGVMCVLLGLAPLTLAADLVAPGRPATAILVAELAVWGLRWAAQFVAFPARVAHLPPAHRRLLRLRPAVDLDPGGLRGRRRQPLTGPHHRTHCARWRCRRTVGIVPSRPMPVVTVRPAGV